MTKQEAVAGAGAKLDRLERTMRRVLWACCITAFASSILALMALRGYWEYYRVKASIEEAQASARRSLEEMRSSIPKGRSGGG